MSQSMNDDICGPYLKVFKAGIQMFFIGPHRSTLARYIFQDELSLLDFPGLICQCFSQFSEKIEESKQIPILGPP